MLVMKIGRTILAVLIAVSVAMLPMTAGAFAKMTDTSVSMALDDGCAHHGKKSDDKAADDCASMAACALKCFNFSQPIFATLTVSLVLRAAMPERASPHVSSLPGLAPFRPPRI
jgi:hypothetical protein